MTEHQRRLTRPADARTILSGLVESQFELMADNAATSESIQNTMATALFYAAPQTMEDFTHQWLVLIGAVTTIHACDKILAELDSPDVAESMLTYFGIEHPHPADVAYAINDVRIDHADAQRARNAALHRLLHPATEVVLVTKGVAS
jgi:hypothetical protein